MGHLSAREAARKRVSIVRVDAYQMGVEGSVVDFRERNAVGNHGLAELLVLVRDDVGRVQQQLLYGCERSVISEAE